MKKLIVANIAVLTLLVVALSFFAPTILNLFTSLLPKSLTLITLSPDSGLILLFMVSITLSLIIYLPIGMLSLYYLLKPALYPNEKQFFKNSILMGVLLFLTGTAFGFLSYLKFGIPFYIWIDKLIGIPNYWALVSVVYQLSFASLAVGVGFLFPVVLNNLIHYDIIKVEELKKKRMMVAIGLALVIVIMPFLPNNPLEQLVVGVPIYVLFEATIFFNSRKSLSPSNAMVIR